MYIIQLCISMQKRKELQRDLVEFKSYFMTYTVEFPFLIQGVTGGTDQTSGGCSLC